MFVSGRTKKRGRGNAAPPAPSTLVVRHKRSAKSSGSPSSSSRIFAERRTAAQSIDPAEAGIVLDRLGKEIVSLLEAGGRKRDRVRRRLRMGINEVTKFLEATAARSGMNCSSSGSSGSRRNGGGGGGGGGGGNGGGGGAIVIISGDVRPEKLVEHLHALVALTGTPYLVLPGGTNSSSTLGRMFGCKTMAAFAICAAPTPAPTPPPPSTPSPAPPPPNLTTTANTPTATTRTTAATAPAAAAAAPGTREETPPLSMSGKVDCVIGIGLAGGIGIGTRGGTGGGGVGLGEGGRREGVKEEEGCLSDVVDVIEGSSEPGLVQELTSAGSVSVPVATPGACRELPVPRGDLERGDGEAGGGGGGGEGSSERGGEGGGGEGGGGGGGRRPRGGRGGGEPAVDDLAGVDEDIDSFVQFLRRKARAPP